MLSIGDPEWRDVDMEDMVRRFVDTKVVISTWVFFGYIFIALVAFSHESKFNVAFECFLGLSHVISRQSLIWRVWLLLGFDSESSMGFGSFRARGAPSCPLLALALPFGICGGRVIVNRFRLLLDPLSAIFTSSCDAFVRLVSKSFSALVLRDCPCLSPPSPSCRWRWWSLVLTWFELIIPALESVA
ncbi:hypothetical protein Bca4012_084345 [Brassica carinata]